MGTGLGGLSTLIKNQQIIKYSEIPGFPCPIVEDYNGCFIVGEVDGKIIIVLHGRCHYYEGFQNEEISMPIRAIGLLGIKNM